uniref:Neurotransmitter-gated ion-channel transmembrane domain-containing protein n=1 Tax=Anopheles culicifacies TaxID=139723 RepID=A0A182MEA0_9DIPT
MVLDRFFLWVFTISCIFGTFGIIFQSPSLYDTRAPVDQQLSEIPLRKNNFMLPPDITPLRVRVSSSCGNMRMVQIRTTVRFKGNVVCSFVKGRCHTTVLQNG